MNDFMELHRLMAAILRKWWLTILFTAMAAATGYFVSQRQTPMYEATTTVLVGQSIKAAQLERVDIQTSQALVQTYVDIARRQPVLDGVVKALELDESWLDIKKRTEVSPVLDTQLIEIRVEANSPEMARTIADEIANQLLLISPSSVIGEEGDPINNFNEQQVITLQEKIINGQRRLDAIEIALDSPLTEAETLQLQSEKIALEGLIVEWGRNYTELLPFTLIQPERDPNQLTVIETAHSSDTPIRPRVQLNTIISGMVGFVLSLALIFILDFLDDTYRIPGDFSRAEDLNILGSIGRIRGRRYSGQIIAHLNPRSAITESYRIVRSRIRFRPVDKPAQSIVLTSSMQGEGKSLTAANLAIVFAQANLKTIIVDADLRAPVLHRVFGVENTTGLGDLLGSMDLSVEDCLKPTSIEHLQILTSGKTLVDPAERLGSQRMMNILAKLNEVADIIIFDSPPVLMYADAIELSRQMDGAILVVRARLSKRDSVSQALFDLKNARVNLLGSVFVDSRSTVTLRSKSAQFSFANVFLRRMSVKRVQSYQLSQAAATLPAGKSADGISTNGNSKDSPFDLLGKIKPAHTGGHRKRHRAKKLVESKPEEPREVVHDDA